MRIGIDAKWYFDGHPSGKVVIQNIVNSIEAISQLDDKHHYYIYLDRKSKIKSTLKNSKNITYIYIWSRINMLSNLFVLPFYGNLNKIDILLSQNFSPFIGNFKRVTFIHDILFEDHAEFFSLKERVYFSPMKLLAQKATHIITISNTEKNRIIKHGYQKKQNITVVYNGVDSSFGVGEINNLSRMEEVTQKYQLPNKYILYVGRLNIRKNIRTIIQALPFINDQYKLVIVGATNHKIDNKIYDHIKILNLQNRILFLGYVDQKDLPLVYMGATSFCFPSFAEGFGIPPLEAMACGTPVIVSSIDPLIEICDDKALFFDPDSPTDLADRFNQLISDNQLFEKMSKEGVVYAQSFSWERSSRQIVNTLEKVHLKL